MRYTDCFAYRGDKCSALTVMICDKSPYCSFYKKESENCNRVKIEKAVAYYSSPKSLTGGIDRRYEKADTKPTAVSQGDTPN